MYLGRRLFIAPDARAVRAALVAGGLGRPRLQRFASVPLEPGALVPSPSGANVNRPLEVVEAVGRAVESLGAGRTRAVLVLPDGIARLALLTLFSGGDARELARLRLGASLPWSVSEAIVDTLPAGRGRAVAAAVRRDTVAAYEDVARSAGLDLQGVQLAPLLVLAPLVRSPGQAVHLALSDTAACFVATRGGVAAVRTRRRDSSTGEPARLLAEAERTASVAGCDGEGMRLVISGSDAARVRSELGPSLAEATVAVDESAHAAEAAWLGGVL